MRITARQLDFSGATKVISGAQKFVVPAPRVDGEPLVHPVGSIKAGQPITDWQGNPIGERGVVFYNGKDDAWQAARTDADHVVIINLVNEGDAAALHAKYMTAATAGMTLDRFKAFLSDAYKEGHPDQYNSDAAFIAAKMTPVSGAYLLQVEGYKSPLGFLKRDDRDICLALYIAGEFEFEGPAATPQQMPRGGVIVKQADDIRAIQPDVFVKTYRLAEDGGTVELDRLTTVENV